MGSPMTSRQIERVASDLVDLLTEEAEKKSLADDWSIDFEESARVAELVDLLGETVPGKLDSISFVIDRLKGEVGRFREWEKELAAKRRSRERAIDRLRSCALGILTASREAGQFVDSEGRVRVGQESGSIRSHWVAKSTSVEGPESIDLWPEEWRSVSIRPDKKTALESLRRGEGRDGFRLIEKEGWRSR